MTSMLVGTASRPSRTKPGPPRHRVPARIARMLPSVVVLAIYAVGVWLVFQPLGLLDTTHVASVGPARCGCSDDGQQLWLLAAAHANLAAGKLPFFTRAVNYPVGVNLLDTAGFPLLATLAAPLTAALGPAATLAVLLRLGMLASASALFFVLRKLQVGPLAAALGGAVYGFSPFMIREAGSHLFLEFAPLPPVILFLVFDALRRDRARPWRRGLLVGLLLVVQALIAIEVAASTVVLAAGVAGVILAARVLRRERVRAGLVRAVPLVVGALGAAPLLAYPLWYLLAGPNHIVGTPSPPGAYPVDPLDVLLPSGRGVVAGLWPGWRLAGQGFLTDLGFVGLPLLLVAAVVVIRRRHDLVVAATGILGGLSGVLLLGTSLHLGGLTLPLPFVVLDHIPLVGAMIPNRLALYLYLAVGVLVAVAADGLWQRVREGRRASAGAAGLAVLASVALIAPSSPVPVAGLPGAAVFASAPGRRLLGRGAVVLAYPYPAYGHDEAMSWQAAGGMRFELLGGYAEHPVAGAMVNGRPVPVPRGVNPGTPTKMAAAIEPPALSDLFFNRVGPNAAVVVARAARQLGPFVERNRVTAVVVDAGAPGGERATRVVTGVFGRPKRVGPLRLWSQLRRAGK